MPIRVLLEGGPESPIVLDSMREDQNGYFWIYSSTRDDVGISVPFPYGTKPSYDCAETEVLLLLNPFQGEAAVMEVTLQPGTKRLGYIFSAVSVGSSNHRYSEDFYFRTACYAATFKTLEKVVVSSPNIIDFGARPITCRLEELFGSDIVILTAHIPYAKAADISLEQLSADLHRHGYVFAESFFEPSPLRLEVVRDNFDSANSSGRLGLRPLSKFLTNDSLIGKFLCRKISCPDDAVLRFFYLYQIIERLLESELQSQSKQLLATLATAGSSGLKIVDAFHNLKEAFSEKPRLSNLFGCRSKAALQTSPTIEAFKTFLRACNAEEGDSYWDNLYKVRNIVIHAWWSIPATLGIDFQKVVAGIENDIPELLLNYSPKQP